MLVMRSHDFKGLIASSPKACFIVLTHTLLCLLYTWIMEILISYVYYVKIISCVHLLVTYDQKMSPTDPESIFQQKIPQSYLKLQESVTDTLKTSDKPPVMRGDEFRYILSCTCKYFS